MKTTGAATIRPMDVAFSATCVAFVRGADGRLRVLLCVDRGDERLFGGDPALLVEHRPGAAASELVLDGPDALPAAALDALRDLLADRLAQLLDDAFDDTGEFRRERLLGRTVEFRAPRAILDEEVGAGA